MVLPALAAAGTAIGGIGSLIGGIRGSSAAPQAGVDYASLYGVQLAPGQTALTTAAQQLGALMGPYLSGLNTSSSIYGSAALSQFQSAFDKDATLTASLGKAADLANAGIIGAETNAANYRTATEFLGPSTAANLANLYGQATAALQGKVLEGESNAANTVTQAEAQKGMAAADRRNKMVSDLQTANLNIRQDQQKTLNQMSLQRAQVEGQMALKRMGAGYALAGAQGFA